MDFSSYVALVTITLLIVALTITAVVLKNKNTSIQYPPIVDNCPDYWLSSYYAMDGSNNTVPGDNCGSDYGCCPDNSTAKTDEQGSTCPLSKCYNVQHLGIESDSCSFAMDFTKYTTCDKQKWSKSCNITWDGITNMPDACSLTPKS